MVSEKPDAGRYIDLLLDQSADLSFGLLVVVALQDGNGTG
jgi:hypothetical protein